MDIITALEKEIRRLQKENADLKKKLLAHNPPSPPTLNSNISSYDIN